jgi:bifunctional non-homologous end joining protein LigD
MSRGTEVELEGRRLVLSNLDKLMYPKAGFTKAQVIAYYVEIAAVLLPHLKGRPLTLKRYPDGVEGPFFYEKRCPAHRPGWLRTAPVWSETKGAPIEFCLADDLPSLVWAANLADLELHTTLSLARSADRPTVMVFDLDPGAPAGLVECAEVALRVREVLEGHGLESWVKSSGSKGLQVYVPLNTAVSFERTKPFAHRLAQSLEHQEPSRITSVMSKELRPGRVFIDWSQNDRHKTTVCVYSLRAKDKPTVSTPLLWDEVALAARAHQPDLLVFEADQVVRRVLEHGDLFAPVLTKRQKLPRLQ